MNKVTVGNLTLTEVLNIHNQHCCSDCPFSITTRTNYECKLGLDIDAIESIIYDKIEVKNDSSNK